MRFEEALVEMRKGNKVKFPCRFSPLGIDEHNNIVECYENFDIVLNIMNTCNIMREDWEIVE